MKKKVAISACLMGQHCRYDGRHNLQQQIIDRYGAENLLPLCPEVLGGLPTPRIPAEMQGNKICTQSGTDVTAAFMAGADEALKQAEAAGVQAAILKAKSPSCGCGLIYDGSFSGRLVPGDGIFTQKLKAKGIKVSTELDYI
ncbi:DUF523 domain-containing protein [Persicobacter diffluens]|uniref:DUF523 domain-containing protein n=1 Tax=Persicobacter diffluens TaxID=981 RepID=A0AAN4VSW9_9BACT|nr:hypothetical protein PEDI_00710 [Persicobacter diffluens]